jgi:NAD(P)-dependent dehydrogenase (short-subunit alcohol dehydrogenase family)
MGRLEGKVAIVTGGGRGIGRGICQVLAREGASVVVADLDAGNADETARLLAASGAKASSVQLDVTDPASAEATVAHAINTFGQVDILVNNAGILGTHGGRDVTLEDWDTAFEVNLKGIWIMSDPVIAHFKSRGGGKIVNIASIAGRQGTGLHMHYSASKAGVINLTQSMAVTFGPRNINVNAVCPGLVRTDMWQKLAGMIGSPDVIEGHIAREIPLRREQTPEDIGNAVAFLASEEARNITGQSLNVDSGQRLN